MRPVMVKAVGYMKPDIDPNTRLYVPFNEGVGSVAKDYSQYGNHAQLTDVEWSPGGFNGAGKFNGSTSFGNCGNPASLNLTDATIEVWVNSDDISNAGIIGRFNAWGDPNNKGRALYVQNEKMRFEVADGSGNRQYIESSVSSGWTNIWNYIVGIQDSEKIYLYRNGVSIDSKDVTGFTHNPVDLPIGKTVWNWYFNGTIDEVRIYAKAQSAAQSAADCYEVVCH